MDRRTRGLQSMGLHRIRQDLVTKQQHLSCCWFFFFFFSLNYFNKTINIYSDIVEAEGVNRQSYVSIPSAAPAASTV